MKYHFLLLLTSGVLAIVSACGTSPVSTLERQSSNHLREASKNDFSLTSSSTSADSAANLVGYIYGVILEQKISENPHLAIGKVNRDQFLKGAAMVLTAGRDAESVLLGIVAGMELRRNLVSIEKETGLKCSDMTTLNGLLSGFRQTDSLPASEAENLLNQILVEHYLERAH